MCEIEKPIKSIYFPPYGLQGQEFSGHVIWSHEYRIKCLKVKLDSNLYFLNIYNVDNISFVFHEMENELEISNVIENAYFGFVVGSSLSSSPNVDATVYFEIEFLGETEIIEDKKFIVNLIRPELVVNKTKKIINVTMPKGALLPIVEPKIRISNIGLGTAIVIIIPGDGSSLKFINYFKNETLMFLKNVEHSFRKLKEDYPSESNLFDDFIQFFKLGKELENDQYEKMEEYKTILKRVNVGLQKIKGKDPNLSNDISQTISDVFYSVFSINKEFESWMVSIESMKGQRILFLNPMSSFELNKETKTVNLSLIWMDMLGNVYTPISIENLTFNLKDTEKVLIPIFELFNTEES